MLIRFLRLPAASKLMILEALLLSAWFRFSVMHRKFAAIASNLGESGLETPYDTGCQGAAVHIGRIVAAVCRRTPWQSACLVQALTAHSMLVRRGMDCTLYMGARRSESGVMTAHAWTRSGSVFVTGGNGCEDYAVTSIYGTATDASDRGH